MSLLSFVIDVSLALRQSSKPVLLGREKKNYIHRHLRRLEKKPTLPKQVPGVRYDLTDHFPEFTEKRGRCRFCPTGYSYVICNKCSITLCLRKGQNCF